MTIGLFFVAQCRETPTLSREQVEPVIITLASDEMQGRQTFTEGIEKASKFIQDQFGRAGPRSWPKIRAS